ncbi:unnamed protein product [Dibothriocephalus latus]|uniref:Uncharacterized protein n=1 Tax=Dibothriocephalus latus TaxID=60516 RepID=A0A3P6Q6M3_DIBLA|nr:unnamed protein product [Dibothriocephalus latus]
MFATVEFRKKAKSQRRYMARYLVSSVKQLMLDGPSKLSVVKAGRFGTSFITAASRTASSRTPNITRVAAVNRAVSSAVMEYKYSNSIGRPLASYPTMTMESVSVRTADCIEQNIPVAEPEGRDPSRFLRLLVSPPMVTLEAVTVGRAACFHQSLPTAQLQGQYPDSMAQLLARYIAMMNFINKVYLPSDDHNGGGNRTSGRLFQAKLACCRAGGPGSWHIRSTAHQIY